MSRPPDNLIGTTLGQYEIIDEIGRGGMATVYRARQPSINRTIAVKVLPPQFMHDPDFFERFKREVDVIAHLEHPHILPIYDYGESSGVPFIAMRFLSGGSLAQLIRVRLPALDTIERQLTQVAQALDHAHGNGIIHRDLKPANILLDDTQNAYLTDFGIARVMNSNLTGSAIIGTPAYMSPEQANGLPVDARSDVYALGIVLFELLTGREPYEAATPIAVMIKHLNEPMPSVRLHRPDVPASVDAVILKATAKAPSDRYASAGEFAAAYRSALRETSADEGATLTLERSDAMRSPTPIRVTAPSRSSEVISGDEPSPTRIGRDEPARRPILMLVVLGIVALGVLAAALVLPKVTAAVPTPLPVVTPTAFPGATLVSGDGYTVAIPNGWQFSDESTVARRVNRWQHRDGEAGVSLSFVDANIQTEADFYDAIAVYRRLLLRAQPGLTPIDEAAAPDGSLRQSFRVAAEALPPGQADIFYLRRDPLLVVVSTYSADTTGNTYVPVLQNILDSLRVNPPA